jgi:molybdopterin converting factor small subunit
MASVSFHYWAGARAVAGVEEETFEAETIAQAVEQATARRADPRFSQVVKACSLLVDGVTAHPADLDRPLDRPVRVEVLPPFAGGA